jgi:tripartite-type tricarboxylate transporter receptor subunit TctC
MKCTAMKVLALALLAAASGSAMSQDKYPNKPIRMIVAWPAGAGNDTVMRLISGALSEELGQTVVVENKPGAAGVIGATFVADAPADGYTLLFSSAAMNMVAAMGTKTSYAMPGSFTPIVNVFRSPMVLVADPKLNIKTPQDIVALSKAKKGDLFYATSGIGAPSHFVAELFRQRAGIQATSVPTKGSPQAMMEQISGRVAFHFAVASTALPPIRDGKVTAVAVSSAKRLVEAPEIPTLQEFGFKDFDASYWNGIFGPKGLSPAIVQRWTTAVNKVLARPDVQERLAPTSNEIDGHSSPVLFAKLIADDYAIWAEVAKVANIKAD